MKLKTKKNKALSKAEKALINRNRAREFGKSEIKDFEKDYEPDTIWFFVKDGGQIVAFGGLRPIKIEYLGRDYNIFGICSIISIKKRSGYGRKLIESMMNYMGKKGKTGLGFTGKTKIFGKMGLGVERDFIKRFIYKNPETGEEVLDKDGTGIYYEGKDKFISMVLKTKSPVYIGILHW